MIKLISLKMINIKKGNLRLTVSSGLMVQLLILHLGKMESQIMPEAMKTALRAAELVILKIIYITRIYKFMFEKSLMKIFKDFGMISNAAMSCRIFAGNHLSTVFAKSISISVMTVVTMA